MQALHPLRARPEGEGSQAKPRAARRRLGYGAGFPGSGQSLSLGEGGRGWPRTPGLPGSLRGVRAGRQARLSWIRTDRGWGSAGGLSGGLRGSSPAAGQAGGAWGSGGRQGGAGAGAAAAAAAAAAAPAGAAAAVAAAATASGRGAEAKGKSRAGAGRRRRAVGEGAGLGAGAGGVESPTGGGTGPDEDDGEPRGPGAWRTRCWEKEAGVGPATGLVGLARRGSASGTEPYGGGGPERDREVNWTMEGGPARRGPPREGWAGGTSGARLGGAGRTSAGDFELWRWGSLWERRGQGKAREQADCKPRRPV